jgi:CheY-like chemotaxis protein
MNTPPLHTVLIVDDDRVNRMALAAALQDECRLVLVRDGESALKRAREDPTISLILLDVSMPGMDGYEVMRKLREDDSTARIAVIFITGLNEEADEEYGLSLGAVDYVVKPIRPAIVRARIRNQLKLISQNREVSRLADRIQLAVSVGQIGIWEASLTDGQFVWDHQMHILYGLEPGTFGGTMEKWIAQVHPDDAGRMLEKWERSISGNSLLDEEFRILHPSGEIRHLRAQSRIFTSPTGARAVGTNWDVTEARRAAETLRQAKETAVAAEQTKGRFLAAMSHEIRTPMNGVLGMARLLADTALTTKQREMLSIIQSSGENLLVIINDILDFSKIEAGKMRISPAPFNLHSLIEETVALLATQAAQKNLELVCDLGPGLAGELMGDAGRLQQIITNLAINAVKFTEHGEVVVQVRQKHSSNAGLTVRFEIRDTGIGISPEALKNLFKPFSQADGSITRRFGGTGLGLAICRQLVDLMGGRIEVDSTLHSGSCFAVELTFPVVTHSHLLVADGLPTGLRTLLVDDSATSRRVIAEKLTVRGVAVEVAPSAEDLLHRLRNDNGSTRPYDFIIIDRKMPITDGLELGRALRADSTWGNIPLILIGPPVPRAAEEAAHAGFQFFITKPVRDAHLSRAVLRVLGEHTSRDPIPPQGRRSSPRTLRLLVAEDNDVNQLVAQQMLQQLGHSVEIVTNGEEVLDRLSHHHYDAVLMDCHMPKLDGYQTTELIRRGNLPGVTASIPIIALTASAMSEDRQRCLDAGMDAFISKPFRWEAIEDVLISCGLLHTHSSPLAHASSNTDQTHHAQVLDPIQVTRLQNVRSATGISLWDEVKAAFIDEMPALMEKLPPLVESRDIEAIGEVVHHASGSCALIGARTLQARLQAINSVAKTEAWDEMPPLFSRMQTSWDELKARISETPVAR